MSYASLLPISGLDAQFLCVMRPKKHQKNWTVVTGFEYTTTFDLSDYISVSVDGTDYTLAGSSSPLSVGEYYFNSATDELFINTGANPNTANVVVVTYELFFATSDAYIGRDPLDSMSTTVHYEGLISAPPQIKQSVSDSLFGYMPIESSSITFKNGIRFFESHLYDVSYNNASIEIYHALRLDNARDFESANVKKIIDGVMSDVFYKEGDLTIKIVSRLNEFDTEYRNMGSDSFYTFDTFPSLDPNSESKPIRFVYGWVSGFVPVNIDFEQDSPTTSTNRDWVCVGTQTGLTNISRTVTSGSTTTNINLDDVSGIRVGDFVHIDKTTDEYREVLTVDYGANSFTVSALSSGAPVAADTVNKRWVSRVEIERDEIRYPCYPNRDYDVATFAGTTSGFSFNTSMESNTGLPSALQPSDKVFITIYGKVNDVTVDLGAGAVPLGADDTELANLVNPIVILFDLLANKLGLGITEFDQNNFQTLATANTEKIGLAIPKNSGDSFPTYKDLITQIVQTVMFKFYIDDDDLWTLALVAPFGAADKTITNDEIAQNSLTYGFEYMDIVSDVNIKYAHREVNSVKGRTDPDFLIESATSAVARYLHGIDKTEDVESLHIDSADAAVLATRRSWIFGDRRGTLEFRTNDYEFLDTEISNVIDLQRTAIPGIPYDEDVIQSSDFNVLSTIKDLRGTMIISDDQKGIEDADDQGVW